MLDNAAEKNQEGKSFLEIVRFAVITLIIVIPIRAYIAQPFIVNGASMAPTFASGEYLIVDELSYHFKKPVRGEVVVFRYPDDPSKFFIKRIIGLPGESVVLKDSEVAIIKGEEVIVLDESYIKQENSYGQVRIDLTPEEYFVMGDNRDVSSDSRIWGPLNDRLLEGRVILRLLPLPKAEIWPGQISE